MADRFFFKTADPEAAPAVPRDASTVILARDGAEGLEVFMLERHLDSDFAGGAYVFPGGTLDAADASPELRPLTDGPSPEEAAALVGASPDQGLALYLCAIRETFEEAGALLARREGRFVAVDPVLAEYRGALVRQELSLLDVARKANLRFAADQLHFLARWVTPELSPRRYDARFFVSRLREDAEPLLHDDVETTASVWIRPEVALQRWRERSFSIIFPTRKILEHLVRFPTAEALIQSTVNQRPDPIRPKIVVVDGQPWVVLPGSDERHEP